MIFKTDAINNRNTQMTGCEKSALQRNYVIEQLRAISEKLGRTPRAKDCGSLVFLAARLFGSWNGAIRAAGLKVNKAAPKRIANKSDYYVYCVKAVAEILGHPPSIKDYERLRKELNLPGVVTLRAYYGNWRELLAAAGLAEKRVYLREELNSRALSLVEEAVSKKGKAIYIKNLLENCTDKERKLTTKYLRKKGLNDLRFLSRKKQMWDILAEAVEKGFPDVGENRGREYAMRLAEGETLETIGHSVGLTRERVRQLARRYLLLVTGAVSRTKRIKLKPLKRVDEDRRKDKKEAAENSLEALRAICKKLQRTVNKTEYEQMRKKEKSGWPEADVVEYLFGSWKNALYWAAPGGRRIRRANLLFFLQPDARSEVAEQERESFGLRDRPRPKKRAGRDRHRLRRFAVRECEVWQVAEHSAGDCLASLRLFCLGLVPRLVISSGVAKPEYFLVSSIRLFRLENLLKH